MRVRPEWRITRLFLYVSRALRSVVAFEFLALDYLVSFGHDGTIVCGGTSDILYVDVLVSEPFIYVMGLWMYEVVAENF
jgi:hypothetical protein